MRRYRWTVGTKMDLQVFTALLMLVSLCSPSRSCSSTCICNITHTDCSNLDLSLTLDSVLSQLPSDLSSLTISNNNLTDIYPSLFSNLSSLIILNISKNHLLIIDPSSFSQMSTMELLDLSSNFLENLPEDLFNHLVNLRELLLSDNKLKMLNPKQFQSLAELQHLDLSNNSLTFLAPGTLDGLQNLVWLSLAHNQLSSIQRAMLEPLTALQHLLLEGNPWTCNCSLMPLRHWLEWMLYRGGQVDWVTCSLPFPLQGRDLRHVPMEMFRPCSLPPLLHHPHLRSPASSCVRTFDGSPVSGDGGSECPRQRHRPVSVRRAPVTVVVAGVVCSVVCLMMVAAAAYGCIYATLAAHQQQEILERSLQLQQQPLMEHKESAGKKPIGFSTETKAPERMEYMAFPPEVCV